VAGGGGSEDFDDGGVVLVLGGNDGGGIQIGVPTIVESTGGGGKGEQKKVQERVNLLSVVAVWLGRQFHEHVYLSYLLSLPQKLGARLQIKFHEAPLGIWITLEHVKTMDMR